MGPFEGFKHQIEISANFTGQDTDPFLLFKYLCSEISNKNVLVIFLYVYVFNFSYIIA